MKHLLIAGLSGFFLLHSASCNAETRAANRTEVNESMSMVAPESKNQVVELNEATFIEKVFDFKNSEEWAYKGDRPAIIDFYAEWCGPCKRLAPVLVELQQEYGDKIQIYKVDAEKNRALAAAFGVTAYPTMLFIPLGADPAGAKGLLPKEELERIITEFLKVSR